MANKKRFRIRDIFNKYPLLDRLRIETMARLFDKGVTAIDDSYRSTSVISEGAKDYVRAVNMGKKRLEFADQKPCIFAYYHGQMVVLMALSPRDRMTTLASNSRDGEMIARAADRMGFGLARGSKTHGGMKAGLELMSASKDNRNLLFNVDGPKGPRHIVKDSIIRIAEMSGLPIIPVVCDGRKNWVSNSWDKYTIPFLNTRTIYIFGDPIHVANGISNSERESLREDLSERLAHMYSMLPSFWATV